MHAGFFPFKVGAFDCMVISDGSIVVPDMVNGRPYNPRDPKSGLPMDVSCLLVRTGQHTVLVDTGSGNAMGPEAGKLFENMNAAGVKAAEVDTIILTHAHADHIGGNVDAGGRLSFPNARFVVHRKEWEYWMERLRAQPEDPKSMLGTTRRNLPPIQDRLELIDDEASVCPGITCRLTPGHTPGGLMVTITSGRDELLCLGDLIHHELELIKPDLFAIFDVAKEEAVAARLAILPALARSGTLLFACHFRFPGLGRLAPKDDHTEWQPLH